MESHRNNLREMHRILASRENASSVTVSQMASMGHPLHTSVATAITTLGQAHAPLEQAAQLWAMDWKDIRDVALVNARDGYKTPGFGSSFYGLMPDPFLQRFGGEHLPRATNERITNLEAQVGGAHDRVLFANASLYSAAFAELADIAPAMIMGDCLAGRLDTWSCIWDANYVQVLNPPWRLQQFNSSLS